MAIRHSELIFSDIGSIVVGKINNSEVQLTYRLDKDGADSLSFYVFYIGGRVDVMPLDKRIGEDISLTFEFDSEPVVEAMAVVAKMQDSLVQLTPDNVNSSFHRILSRDLNEVNRNLRWDSRIDCYKTRFFSTLNSIKYIQDDFFAIQKAIVSSGYSAIQEFDTEKVENILSLSVKKFDEIISLSDCDASASQICFMIHASVYCGRGDILDSLVETTLRVAQSAHDTPLSAYNSMHNCVLMGNYLYYTNRKSQALSCFEQGDALMRLCVDTHPRVNFFEIIHVVNLAFLAYAGTFMATGRPMPHNLPPDKREYPSLREVCDAATRIYGERPKEHFVRNLTDLISLSPEAI
ncbi:hypothetical protein [Asticcacaulis tiandongensis]|uniref:hypothetical protein n=1 Tax=Asticcacaulis tiandongensis TaxID=2565365 RepID=UPI00112CE72F|nr:hypothetical protein [Asticcacaulis tiandongensis]